jgi:hypothetical protein
MKIPSKYIVAISWYLDGVRHDELFHEMSDDRLRVILKNQDPNIFFNQSTRKLAQNEIERREALSVKSRLKYEREFRQEVIDAMVLSGMTDEVAKKMTSDEKLLMEMAKKYAVI